jgi:hypothetical protein
VINGSLTHWAAVRPGNGILYRLTTPLASS